MYYSTHQPKAFYQTPQEGGSHTQLNHIPNHAHDQEAHSYGLRDAEEFALVGCRAFGQHPQRQPSFRSSAWVDVGGWSWWADIRLLHLVMNWRPSLTNSRGISNSSFVWSILCFCFFSLLLSWFSGRGTAMSAGGRPRRHSRRRPPGRGQRISAAPPRTAGQSDGGCSPVWWAAKARTSAYSWASTVVALPAPCPVSVPIRVRIGARPPCARCSVAVNLWNYGTTAIKALKGKGRAGVERIMPLMNDENEQEFVE